MPLKNFIYYSHSNRGEFNELAFRAYSGISFSPEKRRDAIIAELENLGLLKHSN